MSKPIFVGLCGLSTRDARLVEIVVSRSPTTRFKFSVADAVGLTHCDIAVVDLQSPHGPEVLSQIRARCPKVTQVCISDQGMLGESRFRIPRRSLLLHIQRVLEQVADQEVLTNIKVQSLPTSHVAHPKHAAPQSSSPAVALVQTENSKVQVQRDGECRPLCALVVDDSLAVRTQLEAAIERSGIKCVCADNAESAMTELSARSFDLIFLDVVMPGIDGYELCRKIKRNPYTRGIPILMLTSRSSPFDRARGALAGCDSYLTKPVSADALYASVDKLLSKQFQNNRKLMEARGYRAAPG
jgi:two-component system, cell cycle response regulator